MPPRANVKFKSMPEIPSRDPLFGVSPDLKEIVDLPLSRVRLDPNQPRKAFDQEKLEELARSIEQHGLLQPITVRKDPESDDYVVIAGERRFRAHQLLRRERIEAIIRKTNPNDAFEIALIENLQREDLTPLEEAAGYARLMEEFGYTQERVAEKVGKSRTTITSILALNRLPEQIKTECATSHIATKSVLIEMARLGSEDEQLSVWETFKNGGTVRAVRAAKPNQRPRRARAQQTEVAKTISFGRSFVRRIEELSDEYLSTNQADYKALLALARQLNARLDAARRSIGEPVTAAEHAEADEA